MLAFLSPYLAKTGVKIGLAVAVLLAIGGLVIWVVSYIDDVRQEGFDAGAAQVKTEVQTQTIIVREKIQRAEDTAPRTPAGVSQRMRAGSF